jgi:hypothetical protein
VEVMWPSRRAPQHVWVDGELHTGATDNGILLERPFKELVAQW